MTHLSTNLSDQSGQATTIKKTFGRETSVSTQIKASPTIVWALLTNAADFPRQNSTITSLEGDIKVGEEIRLKSTLDQKRTFKLKIKEFEPESRLGDNMGERVYTIARGTADSVIFTMTEKIGGLLFPLFAGQIPPFDESFEQFAADLKKEAEAIQNSQN